MAESPFGYESSAINTRRILAGIGGLVIFVLIAIGVIYVALHQDVMPHRAQVVDEVGIVPPTPHLQPHPHADIAAQRQQKQSLLSGYAWTDSARTFARIPIQRAMRLYADNHAAGATAQPVPAASTPEAHP